MSKLLAQVIAGQKGMWSRVQLDSGEVVFVSLANTIRIYSMKRRLIWFPDQVLCEIENLDAIGAAKIQSMDPLGIGAELLRWVTDLVMESANAAEACKAFRAAVATWENDLGD